MIGALTGSGCQGFGTTEPSGTGGVHGRIDEQAGTFDGLAIGDSVRSITARLGPRKPADRLREPVIPANQVIDDFRGPTFFRLGQHWYRYDGVSVFYGAGGVDGFMVTSKGSQTSLGVAIGDPLAEVKRTYPALRCGEVDTGTEYQTYDACAGRIAPDRYIWFGGDPVSNITLGDRPLQGV